MHCGYQQSDQMENRDMTYLSDAVQIYKYRRTTGGLCSSARDQVLCIITIANSIERR